MTAGNLSNLFVYATILILLLALITYSVALGDSDKARKNENIGTAFTWLAFGILLVAVVLRGISSQRAPWGNMYEFAVTSSLAILGAYLFVSLKKEIKYLKEVHDYDCSIFCLLKYYDKILEERISNLIKKSFKLYLTNKDLDKEVGG
ncbi:MAG: hypothetical protein ACO3IH_01355, partial [Candidatus Nanopelagicales bacterium]